MLASDLDSPLHPLLNALVDYAGLFPPAKLDMAPTVENYARYVVSPEAWMLGRLIVPVSRLDEFEEAAIDHLPRDPEAPEWRISALLVPMTDDRKMDDLQRDLERLDAFNEAHADANAGLAIIDTVEVKTDTPRAIDRVLKALPETERAFFEIPVSDDPRGVIAAIAGTGSAAKIRTGGVTPGAIPPTEHVARFLCACARADVPFKATAGLHHPMRSEHNLTYETDSPRGTMHGFLNVFLAAAFAFTEGCQAPALCDLLEERSVGGIVFDAGGVKWKQNHLTTAQIAAAREHFALSFGSCSFDEPIEDLRTLRLL
ncbi:MAG: hypothetical protein ACF8QF_08695 [Phycisphaerales bacterium]